MDHNTIINLGAIVGVQVPADGGDNFAGAISWTQPIFETSRAIFFEDNTFTFNNFFTSDMMDCQNGGRYVFRHNTVSGNTVFGHGYDSVANGCLEIDVYGNTIDSAAQATWGVLYRGGTGVVYHNILKGSFFQTPLGLTNYRSASGGSSVHNPFCDGSNSVDGDTAPQTTYHGWPCHQQIGRGTNNGSYPLYEWDNCKTSLGCTGTSDQVTAMVFMNFGGTDYTTVHIQQNRDFYDSVSPFDGTKGVGQGIFAARPPSCVPGVGYWATDRNTLYTCTGGNAFTTYYSEFQYPHPLQAGHAPPLPPGHVTAVVR